jgi:hypothetical protein
LENKYFCEDSLFWRRNALPKDVLAGLKNYEVDITTITSRVDGRGL